MPEMPEQNPQSAPADWWTAVTSAKLPASSVITETETETGTGTAAAFRVRDGHGPAPRASLVLFDSEASETLSGPLCVRADGGKDAITPPLVLWRTSSRDAGRQRAADAGAAPPRRVRDRTFLQGSPGRRVCGDG